MSRYFQHPHSGHVIKAVGNFPWLWTLLFGPFYFGYKGHVGHAILAFIAAFCTVGISMFIYPFFASGIVTRGFIEKGWREVRAPTLTQRLEGPAPLPRAAHPQSRAQRRQD